MFRFLFLPLWKYWLDFEYDWLHNYFCITIRPFFIKKWHFKVLLHNKCFCIPANKFCKMKKCGLCLMLFCLQSAFLGLNLTLWTSRVWSVALGNIWIYMTLMFKFKKLLILINLSLRDHILLACLVLYALIFTTFAFFDRYLSRSVLRAVLIQWLIFTKILYKLCRGHRPQHHGFCQMNIPFHSI